MGGVGVGQVVLRSFLLQPSVLLGLAKQPGDLVEVSVWGRPRSFPGPLLASPRQRAAWRPHPGSGDLLRTPGWERLEAGGAPPLWHGPPSGPGEAALLLRADRFTACTRETRTGARSPGSVCTREGSPADARRCAGASPLEGAPRRSPSPALGSRLKPGWAAARARGAVPGKLILLPFPI